MPSIETPTTADSLLQEDTVAFLKHIGEKAAVLAAASRGMTAKDSLTSSKVITALQATAEVATLIPEIEGKRQELLASWSAVAERELYQLEADLRDQCSSRGWRIEGQWPKLVVERGIDVFIDSKKRRIEVGSTRMKDLSAKSLISALGKLVPELIPPTFSCANFLEALAIAHMRCTDETSNQVPIFDIYKACVIESQPEKLWRDARTTNFAPLSIDQFRARLSALLEAGPLQTKQGQGLRVYPPLHPREAIFVFQAAQQRFGYIGRIAFPNNEGGN